MCGCAAVWVGRRGPGPGLDLMEAHVLRQLCRVLEAAWAEWAGVRWARAGTMRGAVPGQVAGALEGLAAGTASEGLEVRVRHAVALQPQRAGKDTSALRATVALSRAGLWWGRHSRGRGAGLLLRRRHRVCVGDPVGVNEQVSVQQWGSGPRCRGRSGGRPFRLGERGSLGGRWVHGLRRGRRVGWPRGQQQHLEQQLGEARGERS